MKEYINLHATYTVLELYNRLMYKLKINLDSIIDSKSSLNMSDVYTFIANLANFSDIEYYLQGAFEADKDQLQYQDNNSDDWKLLLSHYEEIKIENEEKFQQQIQDARNYSTLMFLLYQNQKKAQSSLTKRYKVLTAYLYYKIMSKKIQEDLLYGLASLTNQDIMDMLRISQSKMYKDSLRKTFPAIRFHEKLYVPMLADKLTKEECLNYFQERNGTKTRSTTYLKTVTDPSFSLDLKNYNASELVKIRLVCPSNIFKNITHPSLTHRKKKKKKACCSWSPCWSKCSPCCRGKRKDEDPEEEPKIYEKVIIHIHGGAYCA